MLKFIALLIGIISCSITMSQAILSLDTPLQIDDYQYDLQSIELPFGHNDCVGFKKILYKKELEPLFLPLSVDSTFLPYLKSAETDGETNEKYSIRFNELFLSQNGSIIYPMSCAMQIHCDFIVENPGGDELVFSYGNTFQCRDDKHHEVHQDLFATALSKALSWFKESRKNTEKRSCPSTS